MKQALRTKKSRAQVSSIERLPAPTKGWYVGEALAEAPAGTALILDNGFPQSDFVRMRRGAAPYATGIPGLGAVSSLMTWTNGLVSKMFAATPAGIFDVSIAGVVGAAAVSPIASPVFESVQFTGTGGTFLICVNGYDPAQIFTGSAWQTTPAITGPSNPLAQIWTFKNRLYGVERDTLNVWYGGLDAIGGAFIKFPLTSVFQLGGTLLCGGNWVMETSAGLVQSTVFVTTEGEVAVYTGSQPGASDWTISGLYKVSRPLGRRCLMRAGGDLGIMTEDGIVPLSKVVTLDQVALQNAAVTKPIAPAWRQAVIDRAGLPGWQIVIWPLESMGIINLPKTNSSDRTQFIANVRTGAWARYLGWDANCFAVFNNQLFYGTSDGRVMQAEVGGLDDGSSYAWTVFPSFASLKTNSRKQVRMVRPFLQANFQVQPNVQIHVDYDTTVPGVPSIQPVQQSGALWDAAVWDVDNWPFDLIPQSSWIGAGGDGAVVSPVMQVALSGAITPDVRLTATDILFEVGNAIG